MSITINGATNTITAASGLTVAGNTAVSGTLAVTEPSTFTQDASTTNPITVKDTAAAYATNDNYIRFLNSTGTFVGGITHPAVTSLGVFGVTSVDFIVGAGIGTTRGSFSSTGLAVTGKTTSSNATVGGAIGTAFQNELVNTHITVGDWAGTAYRWIAGDATTTQAYIGAVVTSSASNGLSDLVFGVKTAAGDAAVTEKMRLSSTALTLGSGVNLVMASGQGIDFSATSNGSGTTTSEVLSDYEEGTFTPTITFATAGDLSVTYSGQTGTYTKVGRQVTVRISVSTSAFTYTTASGIFRVAGLPFVDGSALHQGVCAMRGWTSAGFTQTTIRTTGSAANYCYITKSGSGQAPAVLQTTEVPSGGTIDIDATLTYFV